MKGKLFRKLEGQTNSKNKTFFKRHFFGYILYLFKKWRKTVSVLQNILFYILLIELMQKINKKLSFTWLWENVHSCNMIYQS